MKERYVFDNDWSMEREEGYFWHLRDSANNLVGVDQYRNDLINRYGLQNRIRSHTNP